MKWPKFDKFDIQKHTIMLGYMGSQSHGTWIPPENGGIDDKDVMGVCVPPANFIYGLQKFEQLDTWVDEYDIVIYDIRKYFRLLLKSNPNVIGLLWLPETGYIIHNDWTRIMRKHRDIFSSKKIYKSFTGYAYSQLKKMQQFNHQGYMGEKRKVLVTKFGYDTKNAAHLIRLLRMGIEFLCTGELNVMRPDAKQLIAIKRGEYSLEKIKGMSDELFNDAREALIKCELPNEPDYKSAEKLMMEMIEEKLSEDMVMYGD